MNKICRICLEEGAVSSIFANNFNLCLNEMIEYCCNIKISQDDGLPELMCSNCMYKLGIAYHFKQTCMSSDVRLRQYLGLQAPNKTAEVAVMTDPIAPVRQTLIKKCKCQLARRKRTAYKRKPEAEKCKRGPKPKPKEKHECYECGKEFRCQAQLDMHVRTHTGAKPFQCVFCPRNFSQKHNLTIHVRVHTGEKPFQCEICSKSFSAQGNLAAHIKIHTGQKDHVCSICNKSFITTSELTRHIATHKQKVKKFKCDHCHSAYVHSRDLNRHKLKKHQISMPTKKPNDNIDITTLDVGKEAPLPVKHINHLIPHLVNEKPQMPLPEPPKDIFPQYKEPSKDIFPQYKEPPKDIFPQYNIQKPLHTCVICRETFDYISMSQHYAVRHKDFNNPMAVKLELGH